MFCTEEAHLQILLDCLGIQFQNPDSRQVQGLTKSQKLVVDPSLPVIGIVLYAYPKLD